jgi:hypothetical protein
MHDVNQAHRYTNGLELARTLARAVTKQQIHSFALA